MWNRLTHALIFLALLYSERSVADAWSAYAVDDYGTFYFFVAEPQQPDGVTLVKDLASYRRDGKNGAKSEQTLLEVDCVSKSIRERQHFYMRNQWDLVPHFHQRLKTVFGKQPKQAAFVRRL